MSAQGGGVGAGRCVDGRRLVKTGVVGVEWDGHEGGGDGAQDYLRMGGLALPDDAERDDGVVFFRAGEPLDLERNLEGAGHADDLEFVAFERGQGGHEAGVG